MGAPGRLIIRRPLILKLFKIFLPITWLPKIHEDACPKLLIFFGEIVSRVETRIHFHRISDDPTDVLTPLMDWLPAQLLGWLAT